MAVEHTYAFGFSLSRVQILKEPQSSCLPLPHCYLTVDNGPSSVQLARRHFVDPTRGPYHPDRDDAVSGLGDRIP